MSLSTAKKCGIPVPESFIINTGRGKDPEILFATTRYDRVILGNKKINGLPRGERYSIDEIDEVCIRKAAIEAGIGESIAMKRYERIFKSGGIRNVQGGRL